MDSIEYLHSLNNIEFDLADEEMKEYAKLHDVPIIQDEGLMLLRHLVMIKNPKKILEIGTAIGFSAINMAKYSNAFITTIEINEEMFNKAIENIAKANLTNRIDVNLADALEFDISNLDCDYDMIFIDAAKSQYIKFFEKYEVLLKKGGLIVTDNLIFHGLVTEEIRNRNLRQLVGKIKKYNSWLMDNKNYITYIYGIGDGIALSIKK